MPLKVVITSADIPQLIFLTDYIVYLDPGTAFDPETYIRSVRNSDLTNADPEDVTLENAVNPETPGVYDVLYSYRSKDACWHLTKKSWNANKQPASMSALNASMEAAVDITKDEQIKPVLKTQSFLHNSKL